MNRVGMLALILSASTNVGALGVVGFHRWHGGQLPLSAHAELGLSTEQQREFERIETEFDNYHEGCHGRMATLRNELHAELAASVPDLSRVEGLLRQMGDQMTNVQRRLVEQLLTEKALLRPDQLPAFEKMLKRGCVCGHRPEAHHQP
jgi:Spy/CpxP family protein refolding chaperone